MVTLATSYPRVDVAAAPVPSPVIDTDGATMYPSPASEATILAIDLPTRTEMVTPAPAPPVIDAEVD